MKPPIRERLGWRSSAEASVSVPASRSSMAAAGFWFAASAALLTLLALVAPHDPGIDEAGVAIAMAAAAAMAAVALAGFDRLPGWTFQAGCALASAVASGVVYYWGEGSLYGPLPYLWPALYAFYFFPLRSALLQLALLGALYAGVLVAYGLDFSPIGGWLATVGTLVSAGLLVATMRDRLNGRIEGLADAAQRDPLTHLLNRRGFDQAFDVEIERARRTEQSLSVILGDLDRFKQLNDRFGHATGDEALRKVGEAIVRSKRSWDAAARVGGEEFAIIAPDTDEHGAYILAERVRTAMESDFDHPGGGPLTASFGIVSYPVHGQTAEALLKAGDQALYAAKRLGRNRSVISSAEVPGILARTPRSREDVHVDLATMLNLAEALDVRDDGSATHCQRVGRYSELIARELGLAPDAVERVRIAGVLHDVGRVGVPDELFSKQGPLTEDEWHWIRCHPAIGARMLETTEFEDIGDWILAHHERPDGTGYPARRGPDEVPLEAAILGVADAYEAMTAARSYRAALDPRAASEELRRGAGSQWEGRVVEALLRVV